MPSIKPRWSAVAAAALAVALVLALLVTDAAAQSPKMEPVKPAPVAADPVLGKTLYERYCVQCHGVEGKGDGPAADFVYPRPRDFTLAVYKVRSTLSGKVPTDHDLFRVISQGLPGTSMPAWDKFLSEAERWQLVHHVKTLDTIDTFKEEPAKEQLAVANAPKVTEALIARGKVVYDEKKCWQCHGQLGRGDGPSADGMKDDWGFPIRPVNFTKNWIFRGGARLEDIYRTFTTGFNGTPMPSFAATINDEDRWALAAYVQSLTRELRAGQVVRAGYHAGELPRDPYDPAWAKAARLDVLLAGQIVLEPRWFTPAHDVIGVRALYNDSELALMLVWDDGTNNVGAGGKPPDQAAVQLPSKRSADGEKPYFLLGDRANPVERWRWSASQGLARETFAGAARHSAADAGELRAEGGYKDGQYRVIFRSALKPQTADGPTFDPVAFLPVAFHLWDGDQGEEGLKVAISSWLYLLLEPPADNSVFVLPLGAALIVLGAEVWLARRMRRRKALGAASGR